MYVHVCVLLYTYMHTGLQQKVCFNVGCSQNKVKAIALGEMSYIRYEINATNTINCVWHKILEEKEVTFFFFEEIIREDLKAEANLGL